MKVSRLILGVVAILAIASWSASSFAGTNSQLAQLYQLQAAFHRAASVHDPVNGDSATVIDQRIRDMLSLWTDDGSITLEVGGALDGDYVEGGTFRRGLREGAAGEPQKQDCYRHIDRMADAAGTCK